MMLPRPLLHSLLGSAVLLWIGVRLLGFALMALFSVPLLAPFPFGVVFFPAVTLALARSDMVISREWILYENLGLRPATVAAIVLPTVASLELLAGLVL